MTKQDTLKVVYGMAKRLVDMHGDEGDWYIEYGEKELVALNIQGSDVKELMDNLTELSKWLEIELQFYKNGGMTSLAESTYGKKIITDVINKIKYLRRCVRQNIHESYLRTQRSGPGICEISPKHL